VTAINFVIVELPGDTKQCFHRRVSRCNRPHYHRISGTGPLVQPARFGNAAANVVQERHDAATGQIDGARWGNVVEPTFRADAPGHDVSSSRYLFRVFSETEYLPFES
jgi:hypothetical protein